MTRARGLWGTGWPPSATDVPEITAETRDGIAMGLRHRELDVEGVQFLSESILTHLGHDMIANFLSRIASAV